MLPSILDDYATTCEKLVEKIFYLNSVHSQIDELIVRVNALNKLSNDINTDIDWLDNKKQSLLLLINKFNKI